MVFLFLIPALMILCFMMGYVACEKAWKKEMNNYKEGAFTE